MLTPVDKFNMVSMNGIEVLESNGATIEGLYLSLLDAVNRCHYVMLYDWSFAKIQIAPSYVEVKLADDLIVINDYITVSSDDIIHINFVSGFDSTRKE